MILLRVLTGGRAGTTAVARRFPFRVGRGAATDLRLEAPGIWDQHFEITPSSADGFTLSANPASLTLVNGVRAASVALKNGDQIECGDLRLQFWLSPAQQRGLRARETATWLALAGLVVSQACLCWWLPQ